MAGCCIPVGKRLVFFGRRIGAPEKTSGLLRPTKEFVEMNTYGYYCWHCHDITHFNGVVGSCLTCGKDRFREAYYSDVKKLSKLKWSRWGRFRRKESKWT